MSHQKPLLLYHFTQNTWISMRTLSFDLRVRQLHHWELIVTQCYSGNVVIIRQACLDCNHFQMAYCSLNETRIKVLLRELFGICMKGRNVWEYSWLGWRAAKSLLFLRARTQSITIFKFPMCTNTSCIQTYHKTSDPEAIYFCMDQVWRTSPL